MLASFWFGCALLLAGCDTGPEVIKLHGNTMGTTYHITLVGMEGGQQLQQRLQAEVERELAQLNQQLSTYVPDSELNRFNRAAAGEWLDVSAALFEVLEVSHQVSELSGGAFDPTVAPLVELWGFGPEPADSLPAPAAIAAVLQRVAYTRVELHSQRPALRKRAPVSVDLSAVAKGYGADRLGRLFDTMGAAGYLVEIGGELRLKGLNPRGEPWRIGIEVPALAPGGAQKAIQVTDAGLATSGDYRNYFEKDGKRYSHTIDPRSGYPIEHGLASVTVVASSSARADALATALNVLGPQAALQLAEQQGIAAYFIEKVAGDFREFHSAAFAAYLPGD